MAAGSQRWDKHPALATALDAFIFLVPIAAGITTAIVFSHLVPRPNGIRLAALWWIADIVVSAGVSMALARPLRRLVPLASLLKLSLAFPDQTPSRFSIALRAGTVKNLKRRMTELDFDHPEDVDMAAASARILELAAALNVHDRQTRGHGERVRALTDLIADEMHLSEADHDRLRWAALLHDVGKLNVPTRILNKPDKLDAFEWQAIHQHPADGARIAGPLLGWLGEWGTLIEQHHERYDGNGYPNRLAGTEICLGARIVAVADAFDVMTNARSYTRALKSPKQARSELAQHAGAQFDPTVVRAFLEVSLGRLRWITGPLSWLGQLPFLQSVSSVGTSATAAVGSAATVVAGAALGVLPIVPAEATPPQEVATPPAQSAPATANSVPAARVAERGAPSSPETATAPPATTPSPAPVPTTSPAPATTTTTRNVAPIAVDDEAETQTASGKPVLIDVLANDGDGNGSLTGAHITIVVDPTQGRANVGGGAINYVPNNDASGTDQFTYQVCDDGGLCDTAVVTVRFI